MNRLTRSYNLLDWGERLEHVGDLTHRMSENVNYYYGNYEAVKTKVYHALEYLSATKGSWKEILNSYPKEDLHKIVEEGEVYSKVHADLPVYNNVQRLGRDAAVALGRRDWANYEGNLRALMDILNKGEENWRQEAVKDENN